MPIATPRPVKSPKIETINNQSWLKGVVSAFDDGRTPIDGLRASQNTLLDQDGIVRPRYGLKKYGPQPIGTILGEIFPYRQVSSGVSVNWLLTLQNIDGVTKVYKARPEDSTWAAVGDTTFDNAARCHFVQQDQKVCILNGEDSLGFYDIDADEVTTFIALDDPAAPTLDENKVTGTTYSVYYAVTAESSVGETTGSQLKVSVGKDRNLWDPASNTVSIKWITVSGVKSWNVYAAVTADGDDNPQWGLLAFGLAADTLNFTDAGNGGYDGSTGPINMNKPLPTNNSTAGPKTTHGANINGQLWLVGDKTNPYYLWHDGGGANGKLNFTVSNGGGFVEVGGGSREVPKVIWNFRSGTGSAEIKALTDEIANKGKRYTIAPNTISAYGQSIVVWTSNEDYGFSGTPAPDALVEYGNSTYYLSRNGFKVLGTKPQLQNLLSNDDFSQTIQPDIATINFDIADKFVGVGNDNRLYFAIATLGHDKPNEIWVCDLERGGAWMKPWPIECDWMVVIDDNKGISHHLVLSNNKIYEFDQNSLTADDGEPFNTSGQTGLIYFSKDGRVWARLIKLVIEVLRPQGMINFEVSGFTDDNEIVPLGTGVIDIEPQSGGYGWNEFRLNQPGWNYAQSVPKNTTPASVDASIDIDQDVRFFSLSWQTSGPNVGYAFSRIVAEYTSIGIKNLS